jgi:hypothetical protein
MNFQHALNTPALDDAYAKVTAGAHTGAYGANNLKTPSDAQAQAGTYKMGRVTVQGLRIAIEQPQGSIRSGKSADGKEWSSRMAAHYGYFENTRGADGDGIDCFVGPYPESEQVFVINQRNPGGGFDEHKVMVGFSGERHARGAYLDSYERGWRGLQSLVPISLDQLRWWIKNGKKSIALTAESLPQQGTNPMNPKITWNEAQPDSISLDQVLYQLRRMDGADGLLLDSVTMAEIMEDADGVIALDALVVENAQLTRMAERLRSIMDRSGGAVKAPAVQVSEPFRARGVTNIATIFELSDGQTVSVFFHNPDTAPNKLAPGDEMISWKWLLNKKDITIVVAPEKGQDLNPRLVASRIMKLAEKNSPAFQKANAKRAERMGNIEAIRGRIAEKEATLTELVAQVEAARLEKSQKTMQQEDANAATREEVKKWLEGSGYAVKDAAMSQYTKTIGERVMFVTAAKLMLSAMLLDSSKLGSAALNPIAPDFQAALIPASDGATQPAMDYAAGFEAIKGFVEGREREAVTVLPAAEAATVEYLAIEDASDEQLSFAIDGLQGLYAGESAYFVGNPKNPEMVSSSVGYWSGLGNKPTEFVFGWREVTDEVKKRKAPPADLEPGENKTQATEPIIESKGTPQALIDAYQKRLPSFEYLLGIGARVIKRVFVYRKNAVVVSSSGVNDESYPSVTAYDYLESEYRPPNGPYQTVSKTGDGKFVAEVGVFYLNEENERVDAAYQFANATDAFKESVAGSIEETDDSPFASAKAMDMKAKELGAEIHWGMGAALDGVSVAELGHAPAYTDGTGKWHSYTMEAMKRKDDAALRYIIKDATEAAEAGEKMDNPKAAQYRDEAHYASMEMQRRRKGGKQIMDSVVEDDDDFDPEAEFDACPVEDGDLDGDFKGHPFRGNQHKKASSHSHAAVKASMSAKHAEKDGDTKGAKSSHKSAHYSHMAAAEGATGKARKYHRKMAKFHGGRAGMTLDGVEGWDGITLDAANLEIIVHRDGKKVGSISAEEFRKYGQVPKTMFIDDAIKHVNEWNKKRGDNTVFSHEFTKTLDAVEDFQGSIVGQIWKSGALQGHAVIGGDGKAMVFVGESAYDRVQFKSGVDGQMREAVWSDDAADMVEWLLAPAAEPEPKLSKKQAEALAAEQERAAAKASATAIAERIDAIAKAGLKLPEGISYKFDIKNQVSWKNDGPGDSISFYLQDGKETADESKFAAEARIFLDEPRVILFADHGARFAGQSRTKLIEDNFLKASDYEDLANQIVQALNGAIEKHLQMSKAAEPAPAGVYAFKDASDEALGLLRISAQNLDGAYKAAVSVEQSADSHGMVVRWEAVSAIPAMDDASGGLFGDGDSGYLRGDLSYNGKKLASIFVRGDGRVNFELEAVVKTESIQEKMDDEGLSGWNSAWEEVISMLKDHCDENGIAQRPALEIFTEALNKAGWSDKGTGMFVKSEDGDIAIEMGEGKDKWPKAMLRVWREGAWAVPREVEIDARVDHEFHPFASDDEVSSALSELLAAVDTLQAWLGANPSTTPETTVTPDPEPGAADPKTEDRAFFMSVIDGSHPEILEPELADKLAQAYERHAGDAEITSLFMQAGNAYTQAMLAATEGV